MRVVRATALGMCFGVRDALEAMDAIPAPAGVTIHGELVHNETILTGLRDRGFTMTPEVGRTSLPVTETVVITAHGVSDRERARLLAAGKALIDTTCPLVRRVHEAAQALAADGRFVLVIGRPDHVEVLGIVGDLDRYEVVPSAAAARAYGEPRLGVICQSTTTPDDAERVTRGIQAANPAADVRVIDTICRPTKERQQAARDLLAEVEALVVVGGRRSNNTLQLARMAADHGVPVRHVQSAADLDPDWLAQFAVVGLTAGTSTPDATIDAVERAMLAMEAAVPAGCAG